MKNRKDKAMIEYKIVPIFVELGDTFELPKGAIILYAYGAKLKDDKGTKGHSITYAEPINIGGKTNG